MELKNICKYIKNNYKQHKKQEQNKETIKKNIPNQKIIITITTITKLKQFFLTYICRLNSDF